MDYYEHFFKMKADNPEINIRTIYVGICQAIADSQSATKKDLSDVTRAYREEVINERINTAVSAS